MQSSNYRLTRLTLSVIPPCVRSLRVLALCHVVFTRTCRLISDGNTSIPGNIEKIEWLKFKTTVTWDRCEYSRPPEQSYSTSKTTRVIFTTRVLADFYFRSSIVSKVHLPRHFYEVNSGGLPLHTVGTCLVPGYPGTRNSPDPEWIRC